MRPLVRLDVNAVATHVASVLTAAPQLPILGAYLFGSALGECRPESDVDVALVPAPGAPLQDWELQAEAECVLAPYDGHAIDVSVLRPGLFAFEVVRTGRLIYVRDEGALWDFVEFVCRRGPELLWRYRGALELVAERIAARTGGGG